MSGDRTSSRPTKARRHVGLVAAGLIALAGCNGVSRSAAIGSFHLESQRISLLVRAGAPDRSLAYLRVSDWDAVKVTATLANQPAISATSNALLDPDGLGRSATLQLPGLSPGTGYRLDFVLLKTAAGGQLQPVATAQKTNVSLSLGTNTIDLAGSFQSGIQPSIPPVTAFGAYVESLPGFGPSARLSRPNDITGDGQGRYFILDNGRLRLAYRDALGRWSLAGIAGTDAGGQQLIGGLVDGAGPSARFQNPQRLAYDPNARALYVADTGNNCIRRVTFDAKGAVTVSTVAGDGTSGYLDGPGANARFNAPQGLAVDRLGNVYVGDSANGRIRKIAFDAQGNASVSTFAGDGTQAFQDGPALQASFKTFSFLAIGADDRLYVADTLNFRLRAIGPDAQGNILVTTVAGSTRATPGGDGPGATATFFFISAMTEGSDGNLYLDDGRLRRVTIDASGATVSTIAGGGTVAQGTSTGTDASLPGQGLYADTSGIYVLAGGNVRQVVLDNAGQATVSDFLGDYGFFAEPAGDGPAVYDRNFVPYGLALYNNKLFISMDAENEIRCMDLDHPDLPSQLVAGTGQGGYQDGLGEQAQFNEPMSMAVTKNGTLYVADNENECIRMLVPDASGHYVASTVAGTPTVDGFKDGSGGTAEFSDPGGVVLGADGSLFVLDEGNSCIRKVTFDATGQATVSTVAGVPNRVGLVDGPGTSAKFNFPTGLAVDLGGNLLVADHGNNCIRKLTLSPSGACIVSTLAGGNAGFADGPADLAGFESLNALAVDANGTIFATDGSRIRQVSPGPGGDLVVGTLAGSFAGFADGESTLARLNSPVGIVCDPHDNLYVADQGNRVIRKIVR